MENTVNPDHVIYPEVLFTENETTMVVWTRLRKRSNGKYYFWDYKQIRTVDGNSNRNLEKENLFTQLHFEIYLIQVMAAIDFKARKPDGTPLFEKDANQSSEERRLMEKYNLSNLSN